MRDVFGFTPRYTTRAAFDDFVRARGLRHVSPEQLEAVEHTALALAVRADDFVRGGAHA
jgi:UDP-glucose 4-epimerase